jgi:UDP-N-acetylglucosamine 1-carboxyvinyltransferase
MKKQTHTTPVPSPLLRIANRIKTIRTKKGMTQKEFADKLQTSQSAVARIEKGEQNLSTAQLIKIGEVLGQSIVQVGRETDFRITGPTKLHGTAVTNPSKNGALGLLCASLINHGTTTLHNIPQIEEVARLIEIFQSIGISVERIQPHTLKIRVPEQLSLETLNVAAAKKIRSILMMIGGLMHREKRISIPHAGGCNMGERTIVAHKHALQSLGITTKTLDSEYLITRTKLKPAEIIMYEASDTATINALITAACIPGKTVIKYAPPNYQVQDVCFFLEAVGVKIQGIGTTTLTVEGVARVDMDIEHYNSEDPIESMMFITAAVVTNSELTVTRCPIDFLEVELLKLQYMGQKYTQSDRYLAQNGKTQLVDITLYPSKLTAPTDKIHPLPYPGLNIDNLPFFVPIATQATGTTLIHDWTWENRAIYFTELNRLGADIRLADPHRVFVTGPTPLKASQVVCPPALRPSVIILLAMLAAEGTSTLRNVYSIERGYERIAERLNDLGADIEVLSDM